jgi:predicted dinucleotide-binding enzyme
MENITIAILGATEGMGTILAKNFASVDYRLLLFSHKTQELKTLVKEIKRSYPAADLESYGCLVDASWEADIIVFAVPLAEKKYLAETVRQVATQKIVIHTSDHLSETKQNDKNSYQKENDALQQLLPHSKLIKVYLSPNKEAGTETKHKQINVVITGNNRAALETIKEIFIKTGFHVSTPVLASSTI